MALKPAWIAGWTGQHARHAAAMFWQGRNPAARVYESIGSDFFVAPAPGWLNLMRAELAQRRGDPAAGALFAAALEANADVYTRCAYADWLLDQRRPAAVVALLKGNEGAAARSALTPLAEEAVTLPGLLADDRSQYSMMTAILQTPDVSMFPGRLL